MQPAFVSFCCRSSLRPSGCPACPLQDARAWQDQVAAAASDRRRRQHRHQHQGLVAATWEP